MSWGSGHAEPLSGQAGKHPRSGASRVQWLVPTGQLYTDTAGLVSVFLILPHPSSCVVCVLPTVSTGVAKGPVSLTPACWLWAGAGSGEGRRMACIVGLELASPCGQWLVPCYVSHVAGVAKRPRESFTLATLPGFHLLVYKVGHHLLWGPQNRC